MLKHVTEWRSWGFGQEAEAVAHWSHNAPCVASFSPLLVLPSVHTMVTDRPLILKFSCTFFTDDTLWGYLACRGFPYLQDEFH